MFVTPKNTYRRPQVGQNILNKQRGFSMIEVLITVLVLAVGLLGIASLQTNGMRLVRDSGLMGQASILASSMADKMRGNMIAGGAYSGVDGTEGNACTDPASVTPCTVEENDLIEWNTEIRGILLDGTGTVTSDDNIHTITVTWTESQDSDQTDNERTFNLVVRI